MSPRHFGHLPTQLFWSINNIPLKYFLCFNFFFLYSLIEISIFQVIELNKFGVGIYGKVLSVARALGKFCSSVLEVIPLDSSLYYQNITVQSNYFFCLLFLGFLFSRVSSLRSLAQSPWSFFQLLQVFKSRFATGLTQKVLRHLAS